MKKLQKKKAILAAVLIVLGTLSGCKKDTKEEMSVISVVETKSNSNGIYSSEFINDSSFVKINSGVNFYNDKLEIVKVSTKDEYLKMHRFNDLYTYVSDNYGNCYYVNNNDVSKIDSNECSYYAYILNDAPVYSSPELYDFERTGQVVEANQKVLVVNEFDQKYYVMTDSGEMVIIRGIDFAKLPNEYIEIDISDQKLRLYENSEVILESDVVTGRAEGDYNTPSYEGYFEINGNKSRSRTLKGGAYVDYWMPFINDTFGIHDASWRSAFGGNIYEYNGSHGCINAPYDTAEYLYNNTNVGTKVLIHK